MTDLSQLQLPSAFDGGEHTSSNKQSRTADAASQFESLLIGEMLKSVREASDDGWMGGGSDSSAESAFGMAESQFAQSIAKHGGFGLAKTIQRALEPAPSSTESIKKSNTD